jgi:hypothetical protein
LEGVGKDGIFIEELRIYHVVTDRKISRKMYA